MTYILTLATNHCCINIKNYYLRIRKPFESYDKELLKDGYPESSEYLRRLLAVKSNKRGCVRDNTLIKNKALLNETIDCLKNLENCERDGSK